MNMPSQNTTKEGMESSHGRGRRLARTRCQVTCACRAGGVPQVHPFQVNGFYLNSESWTPKIAKALVRTFKLVLKGFDVIPIVAPDDGRLRRLQHTFKVGLETTQVPLPHHRRGGGGGGGAAAEAAAAAASAAEAAEAAVPRRRRRRRLLRRRRRRRRRQPPAAAAARLRRRALANSILPNTA